MRFLWLLPSPFRANISTKLVAVFGSFGQPLALRFLVYPCRYFSKTVQLPVCFGFIHRYGVNWNGLWTISEFLPELFPTHARYSGASLTYNIAGLFGASVAAIIALPLNAHYGLKGVGIYLTLNAVLSLVGLWFISETKDKLLS